MSNVYHALGTLLVLVLGGLLSAYLFLGGNDTSEPVPEEIIHPVVETTVFSAKAVTIPVKTHGIIQAQKHIDLVAEISGQVETTHSSFVAGGRFARGSTLLTVSDIAYKTALADAEAALSLAQDQLALEQARANQAKKEWQDLGSDEANALFLRKHSLAAANTQRHAAQKRVDQAKYEFDKTRIRAPFNGRITQLFTHQGGFVNRGSPVAQFYAIDTMEIHVPVNQMQLTRLNADWPLTKAGIQAEITATVGSQTFTWQGDVIGSNARIEPQHQTVNLVIALKAPEAIPGMHAVVTLTGKPFSDVISLPKAALHNRQFIMTVDAQNRLRMLPATILAETQTLAYVQVPSLSKDTRVVIKRFLNAVDGMQVQTHSSSDDNRETNL